MRHIDNSIAVFNAIVQHKGHTGRMPTVTELIAMVSLDALTIAVSMIELQTWGWIEWDSISLESVRITRPTEVEHDRDTVVDISRRIDSISRGWARKDRWGRVAGMFPKKKKLE